MIDWLGLFPTTLWVAGFAVVLGALSVANYEAQRTHVRLRLKLGEHGFQLWSSAGIALCCTGLLLGAKAWWEGVIWGLLALAPAARATWLCWRQRAGGSTGL